MKTYTINGKPFSLRPVKDITFKEDQLLRSIFIREEMSFEELDPARILPLILLPASHSANGTEPDYSDLSFEVFSLIISDFLAARQVFFLNLPGSIASSVQQNLKSSLNLTTGPEFQDASNPT